MNPDDPDFVMPDDAAQAYDVAGAQPVAFVPQIPVTEEDFAALLRNPDLPAESQAAPAQSRLNPHLFGSHG